MNTVTGHEVIELRLTLDQVTFIVSGLRDLAGKNEVYYMSNFVHGTEEYRDFQAIVQQNRALADELEATYVQQLKG
jgi:hypothetical protein